MAHFLISYDLHSSRTYQPVWNELEGWGAVRLLESLWVVSLNNTAVEIRDALKAVIDGDDSVAVVELQPGSQWATQRSSDLGTAWLRKNILA